MKATLEDIEWLNLEKLVITHDYIFYVLILDKQANVIKLLIQNQKKVKSFDILT